MIHPLTLLTEIKNKLLSITTLSTGVTIEVYDANSEIFRNLDERIESELNPVVILVAYEGGADPKDGERSGTQHDFQLIVISKTSTSKDGPLGYYDLLDVIYNGVPQPPSGEGCWKFSECALTGCEVFNGFEHRAEITADDIEIWRVRFSTREL